VDQKDVEKLVISKLISNPRTFAGYLNKVAPEDFTTPVFKEVIAAFGQNGNSIHYNPSREYFEIVMRPRFSDKDKLASLAGMLDAIAKTPVDQKDLDVLIGELRRERVCRQMTSIIQKTIPNIEPSKIDQTYDALVRELLSLPLTGASDHAAGTMTEAFSDVDARIAMYFKETQQKFKIGMSAFDDAIGGFAPGEFIVMTAGTGQGKSAIMLWMAEQIMRRGGNVCYVTIEMSYEEVMERYHAMTSGLSLRSIRNKTLTEAEVATYIESIIATGKEDKAGFLKECREKILDRLNPQFAQEVGQRFRPRKEKFFVLDIPKNCTPARIEREVARLSLDHPIHACFIDYLNIMEPNFHSRDKVREQASLAQDLKGMFRKLKIIGVAGAQLNTSDLEDDKDITTDDVKYCRAIGENCDWMMAFKRNQNDEWMKQLRLQLAKHRHSSACTQLLDVDFDRMQFKDLGRYEEPVKTGK